jgi:CD109 antigen
LISRPSQLTVFQPFFIALNLPYSIKRGESVAIEASVFNYMTSDLADVTVTLRTSTDFEFVNDKQKIQRITAKAGTGTMVKFLIRPTKIGHITLLVEAVSPLAGDRIQKLLLVEAEGVTEFVNEAVFVDLRASREFVAGVDVKIPNYAIGESVRIEASVIGDLLGPTIENLDKLM